MPKLPRVTAVQAVRALRRAGWREDGIVGSHLHLSRSDQPGKVTVPMHRGDLATGTIKSILNQAGLTADQFRDLL